MFHADMGSFRRYKILSAVPPKWTECEHDYTWRLIKNFNSETWIMDFQKWIHLSPGFPIKHRKLHWEKRGVEILWMADFIISVQWPEFYWYFCKICVTCHSQLMRYQVTSQWYDSAQNQDTPWHTQGISQQLVTINQSKLHKPYVDMNKILVSDCSHQVSSNPLL